MTKTLHRDATRWEPYSDGPWFFAYDPAHREALKELKAYQPGERHHLQVASGSEVVLRRADA